MKYRQDVWESIHWSNFESLICIKNQANKISHKAHASAFLQVSPAEEIEFEYPNCMTGGRYVEHSPVDQR